MHPRLFIHHAAVQNFIQTAVILSKWEVINPKKVPAKIFLPKNISLKISNLQKSLKS